MATYNPFLTYNRNTKNIDFSPWGGLEGFLRDTSNGAGGYAAMNLVKRISPFLSRAVDMTSNAIANLPFHIIDDSGKEVDTSAEWENKVGGMENPRRLFHKIAMSLCGGKAYCIPEFMGKILVDLHYIAPHTIVPLITTQGLQWFSRASDYGNAGIYVPLIPSPAIKQLNPGVEKWKEVKDYRRIRRPGLPQDVYDAAKANYYGSIAEEKLDTIFQDQAVQDGFNGSIMYFWLPDSDIEIGPAKKHPLGTAMISAQTLASMDNTIKLLADRHFVPATLVSAKGMPSAGDREKTENWLNRFMKGAFETFAKIINAETVGIVKLGAGMEDLKGAYADIKRESVESVGAAFGIPAGIFMSDKAYSQEMDALIRLWYSASEFIAIYHCIEDTFNDQLLNRWNYKLEFLPNTLDAFQDDEATRAVAFRDYVSARIRPSIAAQILGMEMPTGMDYDVLDEDYDKPEPVLPINPLANPALPEAQAKPAPPVDPAAPPTPPMDANQQKEIVLWRQMAQRWFRKGKGSAVDFECKFLPAEVSEQIRGKLAVAKTELDILHAFELDAAIPMPSDGLFALAAAVNKLADKA